jgi:uncharacterized protein YndB with AHSA1/START domain
MTRNLRFEVFYEQPRERVWAALTNSDALAAWLMPNDFMPRLGHRFQFRTAPVERFKFDGIVSCEVLEIEPPSRLVYSWVGGGIDTRVAWTLQEQGKGTRLVLEHQGFRGVRGLLVSSILGKGWGSSILKVRLAAVVAGWDGDGEFPPALGVACHNLR